MSRKGSAMRFIGRFRSPALPSSTAAERVAATAPASRRIVVPEFPQYAVAPDFGNGRIPLPSTRSAPSARRLGTPNASNAARIARVTPLSG